MEWISVKDQLPKKKTKCLVYSQGEIRESWVTPDRRFAITVLYDLPVSHWMPLPEPPEDK